jgi:hypothetical protein
MGARVSARPDALNGAENLARWRGRRRYAHPVKIKRQRRGVSTGEKIRQLMVGDQGSPVAGRSKLAQRVEDAREAKRRLSRSRRGR